MFECTLERLGTRGPPAGDHIRLAAEPPGLREPKLIMELFQQRDSHLGDPDDLLGRALRVGEGPEELPLDERAELELLVPCSCGSCERLAEHLVCAREIACLHKRASELRQCLQSNCALVAEQRNRTGQEVDGSGHVVPCEGALTCLAEQFA